MIRLTLSWLLIHVTYSQLLILDAQFLSISEDQTVYITFVLYNELEATRNNFWFKY